MVFELDDQELQTLLEMLKYLLLGGNILLFVTAALVFVVPFKCKTAASPVQMKRALLVTAHPDDESMFFLPLVHSLQAETSSGKDVWETHLLCLSRGNFDGLGTIREQELRACAVHIGLVPDHVHVLDEPELQDGMENRWDASQIAAIVLQYVDQKSIDAVFTFDDYGVSGHPNHIATHLGVQQALREQQEKCRAATTANAGEEKIVRGWALESTNLVRKYIGILDTVLSMWLSRQREDTQEERQFVFVCRPWWNYKAMALHRSQFVWYRRLFVVFSRYTFVNTFRPLLEVVDDPDLPAEYKKMR
uniref:N-acetylglucosaminylphosphatidylinositol deacetylase n=1 Tax=Hyaloperonospora arabidopsidis (strain Emoy2) TaxID=559515 RepID=M4BVJ8_HYAAE